jgi:hypothetical protein
MRREKKFVRPHLNRKGWNAMVRSCHPRYSGKPKIGGSKSRTACAKHKTLSQKQTNKEKPKRKWLEAY